MSASADWPALRRAAATAATRAHAPFSRFHVGAAGLLADGQVLTAANVESATYVAGICAETALVGVMVAGGHRAGDLVAVAVTDPDGADLSPCGRCRQLLFELGADGLVVNERPIGEWLPDAFGPEDLGR